MSISKTTLVSAAAVAVVCIPIGRSLRTGRQPQVEPPPALFAQREVETPAEKPPPTYENSLLFAEWRNLHTEYGTNAEAMPAIYRAVADLKDSFRRRAFRAALIAEWAQVDPAGGLAFFLGKGADGAQRRQFFEEWLALDSKAAVGALLSSGQGWEDLARDCLTDIARRVPSRVAEIAARLPKAQSYWDTKVRDAFAIVAETGVDSARSAAEAMTGANREQALAGVAQAWAKSDLAGAIAWAKALPEGTGRDEIIRAALLGTAAVDPAAALDSVGLVPAGGKPSYFASTTGARVLAEAAKADFEATVGWIAAHPGRLQPENMDGLATAVTERLNADAAGFLSSRAADGSLPAIVPAINSAILNDASGQRAAVWDWLRTQPDTEALKALKEVVLRSAAWQDPETALQLVADLPRTADGDVQVQNLARCLLDDQNRFCRFEKLLAEAPERLRQPLIEVSYDYLRAGNIGNPQVWVSRLSLLSEGSRAMGAEAIARAWAGQTPEEAVEWAASLAAGQMRNGALAAIASTWAEKDVYGAAEWVGSMPAGAERDRCAQSLSLALAEGFPRQAWDWAVSIENTDQRRRAAMVVAMVVAARDPTSIRQWIEGSPFAPEMKADLRSVIERPR